MAHAGTARDPGPLDVLVVGAGPTGLTLALELAVRGVRLRLVDKALDRVHESRALAIQPRTLEVLARDGLARELVERGNPAVELRLHLGGRTVRLGLFDLGLKDSPFPHLLFLSQSETERVIGEHLARRGAAAERGVELTALVQERQAVRCSLRHADGTEETVRARYVVGCDGAHSTVRREAGIAFRGRPYAPTFVLADLEADGLEAGPVHAFVSGDGVLFLFPLRDPATWRMIAMRPRGQEAVAGETVALQELQGLVARFVTGVRLRDPVWTTNFRLHLRSAVRYRAGRVLLAGDAAHIHSPAGAQGMNTGIQDAVNLGWKLALVVAGRSPDRLLGTYEAERLPVGRAVLRLSDRAFTVATSAAAPLRLARARLAPVVVPLVLRLNRLRAAGFRTVAELTVSYRRSPLAVEGPGAPRRGPRAGDRLPDAPLGGGTLHEAVGAEGFHLLLCGPPGRWSEAQVRELEGRGLRVHRLSRGPAPAAGDGGRDGLVLDRLGVTGTATAHLLVRPDGYVAYRGGSDLAGLRAYLGSWLPR
ncbi:FAD-dependent monooxygenase [Georgenia sp. EYE_87]|uniref:FAD-dependent monooxygenase n=1 Tax=Georgenia sp. EYE_87 TaxID=2853448 RepID=UPI0020047505|nr:FAD-dependent monooxygenase [Georgenia sp. EYE_87]MCK6210986.1 FAD-dependent monooxygenase [Georgenia sp. EYE_87]